ncbi:MAG: hypothetical protein WCD44_00200 [Candidatus Babeliales bacterium]
MRINYFSLLLIFTVPSLASDMNFILNMQQQNSDPLNSSISFFSEQEIDATLCNHELEEHLKKVFNFTEENSPATFVFICPHCPEQNRDQCTSDNPYAPKKWYKKHLRLYHQDQEFTEQNFKNNLQEPEQIQQFSIKCPVCYHRFTNTYIKHRLIFTLKTHISRVHPNMQYSNEFFENYKKKCQKIFIPNPKK